MPYTRRIVHYSPGPTDFQSVIADRAIAGCWFELHRQGGCGSGELRLRDEFVSRNSIDIGDWVAFEFDTGDRWYLGRVEHRQANSPAGVAFRLEGMGGQLSEAFPGGFSRNVADGVPPHRYAQTDLFSYDPDYSEETVDAVSAPDQLVTKLLQQYVVPRTDIMLDAGLIEESVEPAVVTSVKFRGEETVRAVVKELAIRARNAAWGVDESGTFFFLQSRSSVIATYREGLDVVSLEESRERETMFNRVLLTGGYVYDATVNSEVTARGFFRWRGNYIQPASRDEHGERRIRMWVPWIRTSSDSREFVREFFRVYSQPTSRYLVVVGNQSSLPKPWEGSIRLLAQDGSVLISTQVETIRVQFDHAPRFRMELGPEDPRVHWPEPPEDERWEVRGDHPVGDLITIDPPPTSWSGSSGSSATGSSEVSSDSSLATSDLSSSVNSSSVLSSSALSSSIVSGSQSSVTSSATSGGSSGSVTGSGSQAPSSESSSGGGSTSSGSSGGSSSVTDSLSSASNSGSSGSGAGSTSGSSAGSSGETGSGGSADSSVGSGTEGSAANSSGSGSGSGLESSSSGGSGSGSENSSSGSSGSV